MNNNRFCIKLSYHSFGDLDTFTVAAIVSHNFLANNNVDIMEVFVSLCKFLAVHNIQFYTEI